MFDVMNSGADRAAGKRFPQRCLDARRVADVFQAIADESEIGALRNDKSEPAQIIDAGFAIDRDVIHVADGDSGVAQTKLDRFGREPGPVFDPPETFLLGGGGQPAIAEQTRGGIAVIRV